MIIPGVPGSGKILMFEMLQQMMDLASKVSEIRYVTPVYPLSHLPHANPCT